MTIRLRIRGQRRRTKGLPQKPRSRIEALRARILLLLHGGHEPLEIAVLAGCARATVHRTCRFEDLGEDGFLDRRAHRLRGRTADVETKLVSYTDSSPQDFGWQRTTLTMELLAAQARQGAPEPEPPAQPAPRE